MEEQMKSKSSMWKELINIRAEIIEIEKKISRGNQWNKTFFENINNINNSLARFMKKIREKTKISYMNERSDSTTYSRDIKRIISECYEKLYANKFIKWDEVNEFLERYNLSLKKI